MTEGKRPWKYGGEASEYTWRDGWDMAGLSGVFVGGAVGLVIGVASGLLGLGQAGVWVGLACAAVVFVAFGVRGYRREMREWAKWEAKERETQRD